MYEMYNSAPYNANTLTVLMKISHKNTFKVYLSVNKYISDSIKRYGCTSNSISFTLLPVNKPTKKPYSGNKSNHIKRLTHFWLIEKFNVTKFKVKSIKLHTNNKYRKGNIPNGSSNLPPPPTISSTHKNVIKILFILFIFVR